MSEEKPNMALKPTRFRYAPAVGLALRWLGRYAPSHRRCEFPSAFCPGADAPGHQAAAADSRPREQARVFVCR
jgi:hypothetical protein